MDPLAVVGRGPRVPSPLRSSHARGLAPVSIPSHRAGERFVTETAYRDARFPLAWGLAAAAGAAWLSFRLGRRAMPTPARGVSAAWRVTALFVAVSFVIWTAQHSVYRYIVVLDMLTGALIVTLLARLLRPGYLPAVAIVAAVTLVATTRVADWGHVDFADRWFDVRAPRLPHDALVLLTTDQPVAYLLPFLGDEARFVAAQNTVNDPSRRNLLAASVRDVVQRHTGPLYQLTSPPGAGASVLEAHGLRRTDEPCVRIASNIHPRPIELCSLVRATGGPAP
jgi:hypothetical protein